MLFCKIISVTLLLLHCKCNIYWPIPPPPALLQLGAKQWTKYKQTQLLSTAQFCCSLLNLWKQLACWFLSTKTVLFLIWLCLLMHYIGWYKIWMSNLINFGTTVDPSIGKILDLFANRIYFEGIKVCLL